jgi:predicted Zn finger-like uncharacterized protein
LDFDDGPLLMHITHCPTCTTAFKVTPDQLKLANGWVRCGRCNAVFEAHLYFSPTNSEPVQIEPVFEQTVVPERVSTPTEPTATLSAGSTAPSWERPSESTPEPHPSDAGATLPSSHRVNAAWGVLSALLALALVWQWLMWQRHWLAAQEPALKPVMQALCAPWGCEVGWPREPDAVLIESSSFNEDPDGGFILQLRMKNTQHHAVATPALELNLTDMQDQVVVRRVFSPQELAVRDNIPALRDVRATLSFELDDATAERIVGFRAFIFYP